MRYCKRCVMPDTKPDLFIDEEGICSACRNYERRPSVDWKARESEFVELVRRYKNDSGYDCIVPVSGGKDSTCQVLKMIELGFKPLAVNANTCDLSELGRRNLDNIKNYCDMIEVSVDRSIRARINKFCLQTVGDISWPEHVLIFTTPVRVASAMGVSLIVWGENPQHEYGGPAARTDSPWLDRRWLEEFGGLLGLRVTDLPFSKTDIGPAFTYPTEAELKPALGGWCGECGHEIPGVTGTFLGHYFPWDGYENAQKAREHGFLTVGTAWGPPKVEASGFSYENLDNHHTGIHDFFKYLKFGFSRATDIACMHVRRGRMTRREAIEHVKKWDGRFPWFCLGKPLPNILEDIDMSIKEFEETCREFTNPDLFKVPEDIHDLELKVAVGETSDPDSVAVGSNPGQG